MKYHFKIVKEEKGFFAKCLELRGCMTEADDKQELAYMMEDALIAYLSEPSYSKVILPLSDSTIKQTKSVVGVSLDPNFSFSVLLRHYRISHHLTQKEIQYKLRMKNIYSYQRLEKRKKTTLSTIQKIIRVFPDFPKEKIFE